MVMITLSRNSVLLSALLVLLFFTPSKMNAQEDVPRLDVEAAFHDVWPSAGIDVIQARANAFVFEGKYDEYIKWEIQNYQKRRKLWKKLDTKYGKKMKACKNEDDRDSISDILKYKKHEITRVNNPYPRHNYVVMIEPSFERHCSFAVEKNTLVFMEYAKSKQKKAKQIAVTSHAMPAPEEFCTALKHLMERMTYTARITEYSSRTMDGTKYKVIVGPFPTHIVSVHSPMGENGKALRALFNNISEAARKQDTAALQSLLPEVQRFGALYDKLN